MRIEKEVGKEAAVALDEEYDKGEEVFWIICVVVETENFFSTDPEEDLEPVENLCAEEERPRVPQPRRCCPGTYDRLLKKHVSCADAMTLREIALGRRMERPDFVLPTDDQYGTTQSVQSTQPVS